jgi:hypothetical protein
MNSKMVMLSVGVVLLLVGALAGYLYGVNSTPEQTATAATTTTTLISVSNVSTISDAYDQVASAYANQLLLLDATNTSALVGGYETNATVEWKGYSGGCDGNYSGTAEIARPLGALLANDTYFLVSNETQTIRAEGNYWVVNSAFHFVGNSTADKSIASPYIGTFQGAIAAQDSYVHVGARWLVSSETWNFIRFDSTFIDGLPPPTCKR